ncbi:MFS transporter [Streptomyces sp. NPDC050560]|uniref:MFS transporter n=1 Tax=Streptomyces sp. NPDC050560 TaxID=3365630 RepID=UPI0037B23465
MSPTPAQGPAGRRARGNPKATLTAACVAGPLMTLVVTAPSVAVPDISADLHSGLPAAQWVVDGYMLTASSSMAGMGSLADRVGHRRVFIAGLAFFAVCMAVAGLAGDIVLLNVARAAAGFGGGASLASVTAMLARAYDGPGRARAFGMFGTFFGAGLAFGPMVGGLLVGLSGWRGVFLTMAVLAALVVPVAPLLPAPVPVADSRFDWPGTAAFSLAVALFVLALVEGSGRGWTNTLVLGSLAGSVLLVVLFAFIERRAAEPMFDLRLFLEPKFAAICLVPVVLAFSFVALVIVLPPYFSGVDGMSPARIGAVLLLLTGPSLLVPVLVGSAGSRIGTRTLFVALLTLSAAGAAWLTVLRPGAPVTTLAGPLLCIGVGYGLALGVLDNASVSTVEPERMGMAAGMFSTVRLTSDVVAMAGLGALVAGFTGRSLAHHAETAAHPAGVDTLTSRLLQGDLAGAARGLPPGADVDAFTHAAAAAYTSGLHATLWIVAAGCALSALLTGLLLTGRRPEAAGAPAAVDGGGKDAVGATTDGG